MPTYEYHCEECEHVMDAFQKISDDPLKECPECGKSALRRGPGGGIGLSFKGSGFYITDYGSKKCDAAGTAEKPCSCEKSKS
ncbi:MAG: hypothetical protein K940chlam7_00146 [Chlamydiae bacterium]|nr:hypothetical protein [Chlamydiota bacterium]